VGLEGELPLLERLQQALHQPVWVIYLGRKAFTPSVPVWLRDGLSVGQTLEAALGGYGWIVQPRGSDAPAHVRAVIESPEGLQVRQDVPISFAERRFYSRRVNTLVLPAPANLSAEVL